MCCASRDFQHIGAGYVLYFSSLLYVILLLMVCFFMNLNKLFQDYDRNACEKYDPKHPCKADWIHQFSVANYGLDFDYRATVTDR